MSRAAIEQLSKSKIELFQLNRMYFEKNRSELLRKYINKFVAIWDGGVVDFDKDKIELAKRVYTKFGYLPIYIQKVEKERQKVRIPSPKIIQ
jgi:hypothetical protein